MTHPYVPSATPATAKKYSNTVDIYAYNWESVQTEWGSPQIIHVWGRRADNSVVQVILSGFRPYLYVEMPDSVQWTRTGVNNVCFFIKQRLNKLGIRDITIEPCWKYRVYGLYTTPDNCTRAKFMFLRISFMNERNKMSSIYNPESPFNKSHDELPINIPNVGSYHLFVHEADKFCDSVLQCTTLLDVPHCGWIRFNVQEPSIGGEFEQFSSIFRKGFVQSIPDEETESWKTPRVMICSWDIETYCAVDNRFPDPSIREDAIIQIGMVFKELGDNTTKENVLLSYGKCPKKIGDGEDEIRVRSFKEEYGVILGFVEEIQRYDPDVLVGFNTSGFDMNYVVRRAELLGIWSNLQSIGRLSQKSSLDMVAPSRNKSKAIKNLKIPGRICLDLYPWIRSQGDKLPDYRLDTVAEHYLNANKDPLKHYDIFAYWKTQEPDKLAIVARYCINDCALVARLMEHPKLQVWTELTELSHIMRTTIYNLVSSGQQIRVYSQIYYGATWGDFVLENAHTPRAKQFWSTDKYSGAIVLGNPGASVYSNVMVADFKSLYPSVMKAYNIDPTSFVLEQDHGKFGSKVHVLNFEDKTDGVVHFEYLKEPAGLFPARVRFLLDARQETKKRMKMLKNTKGNADLINRLDKRQLALKISANSMYGAMGAWYPMIPFAQGAKSITAAGRQSLVKAVDFFKQQGLNVLYGDTDSTFVSLGDKPASELFEFAHNIVAEANKIFPPDVELEMEDVWKWYMMFARKRYVAVKYSGPSGEVDEKPTIKGIEVVRRDNCEFLRQLYMKAIRSILWKEESAEQVYQAVEDEILKLVRRQISVDDLIITKQYRGNYSEQSSRTLPHVAIARMQEARGEQPVSNGERVRYIFVEKLETANYTPRNKLLQSDRVEDPDYFKLHSDEYRLELDYYLTSQILTPITTLLSVSQANTAAFKKLIATVSTYCECIRSYRQSLSKLRQQYEFNEVPEEETWNIVPSVLRKSITRNYHQAPTKKGKRKPPAIKVNKRTQHKLTEFFTYHKRKFEESDKDYFNP